MAFKDGVIVGPVSFTGGTITANSGTNAISISTDASATTVNIGTGGAVKTVTLGSTTSTSATNVKSGSGGIGLTGTVTSANSISITSGTFSLPDTASSTVGPIQVGGSVFLHNFGTNATYVGKSCGNQTGGGTNCSGFGIGALLGITSGSSDTCVGQGAGVAISSGSFNTVIGSGAANSLTTGDYNIALGYLSGFNWGAGSSSNIAIGNQAASESNTIRIGVNGAGAAQQTICYIDPPLTSNNGLTNVTGTVSINSGTAACGISTDASATTVSFATGGAAKTVTLGSTNSSSSLALRYGTGDMTIASATGTVMSLLDTGEVTMPLQPAFLATLTNTVTDVTGDGTTYTIIYDTEIYDQSADFNLATSVFTAPVTGRYHFAVGTFFQEIGALHTDGRTSLDTSNRIYSLSRSNYAAMQTSGFMSLGNNCYADMDAADTASTSTLISGSTKTVDILGAASAATYFSGCLVI